MTIIFEWGDRRRLEGSDGIPDIARNEGTSTGDLVWGPNGALAALLSRLKAAEAENAMLRQALDESTDPLARGLVAAALERDCGKEKR